ncbi:MAG: helix-turn-helix domain-containing protein [Vulcanimicrobiaceae bacterium]
MKLTRRAKMPTKPWREIRQTRSKLAPEERARIDDEVLADVRRMRLPELRKARQLSQATLADLLSMSQGDVSRLERRTDAYVSTLRRYLEAAGGQLRILAEFPDAEPIEIAGFSEIDPVSRENAQTKPGRSVERV